MVKQVHKIIDGCNYLSTLHSSCEEDVSKNEWSTYIVKKPEQLYSNQTHKLKHTNFQIQIDCNSPTKFYKALD